MQTLCICLHACRQNVFAHRRRNHGPDISRVAANLCCISVAGSKQEVDEIVADYMGGDEQVLSAGDPPSLPPVSLIAAGYVCALQHAFARMLPGWKFAALARRRCTKTIPCRTSRKQGFAELSLLRRSRNWWRDTWQPANGTRRRRCRRPPPLLPHHLLHQLPPHRYEPACNATARCLLGP